MIDVNLRGVLYGIAAALPIFRRQDAGHVVNVVSTACLKILPTMGVHAATKPPFARSARRSARTRGRICVSPGMTSTDFASSMTDIATKEAMEKGMRRLACRRSRSRAASRSRSSSPTTST